MNNIKEKRIASLVMGSYLDTLGFFNSVWEFNYNIATRNIQDAAIVSNEIIHQFFALGGFDINIKELKLKASDDTIMMIATKNACLKNGSLDDFMNEYLDILPLLEDVERQSGFVTLNSLQKLRKTNNIDSISYNPKMGGNGAAMRTGPIGLYYYKEEQLEELIVKSLDASRLTHNYPLGFLGGLVTAFFCSLAMRNIEPWLWGSMLLDIDKSGSIEKYMEKNNMLDKYNKDKYAFWDPWYRYVEERLPRFYLEPKDFILFGDRINDLATYMPGLVMNRGAMDYSKMGSTGCGATIFAYDSLLNSFTMKRIPKNLNDYKLKDAQQHWQSLLYFSTLHFGDNDSTGIIAGNWYGALFGFDEFNKDKINQLEFKKEILENVE